MARVLWPIGDLCLYSEPVPDTMSRSGNRVRFLPTLPAYWQNIASGSETQKYAQLLGADKESPLPKLTRPTYIAPGYPWIPGKDSFPKTPLWSKHIELHPGLAAGIHLSNGGPRWSYYKNNLPKGTYLAARNYVK